MVGGTRRPGPVHPVPRWQRPARLAAATRPRRRTGPGRGGRAGRGGDPGRQPERLDLGLCPPTAGTAAGRRLAGAHGRHERRAGRLPPGALRAAARRHLWRRPGAGQRRAVPRAPGRGPLARPRPAGGGARLRRSPVPALLRLCRSGRAGPAAARLPAAAAAAARRPPGQRRAERLGLCARRTPRHPAAPAVGAGPIQRRAPDPATAPVLQRARRPAGGGAALCRGPRQHRLRPRRSAGHSPSERGRTAPVLHRQRH
ncbi:hypothetical protein D9M71_385280 [compost metagenome]